MEVITLFLETIERTLNVKQRSADWLIKKRFTIGGSQIATITGDNPYETTLSLLSDKIASLRGDVRKSNIYTQWGTMFEHVIKRFTEERFNCKILGDECFILGEKALAGVSYSPDGLAIVDDNALTDGRPTRVLFEFKCPYLRIPTTAPPAYYIPQVKYGLDLLQGANFSHHCPELADVGRIAEFGIFAEGVFRRCSFEDLDLSKEFDKQLTPKLKGYSQVRAFGFIGFYAAPDSAIFSDALFKRLFDECNYEHDECNDLGISPPALFQLIMKYVDERAISLYYSKIAYKQNKELEPSFFEFDRVAADARAVRIGALPWKLFSIDYHKIVPTDGYIAQHKQKIDEVIAIIRECSDNPEKANDVISEYISAKNQEIFGDC